MREIWKGMVTWPTAIVTSSSRTVAMISLFGCVLAIVMTLQPWLGIRLLPVFDGLVEGLRYAAHFLLHWTFYVWVSKAISVIVYGGMLLLSVILPIVPVFPHWKVPALVLDLSIISLIIVRAFGVAYTIVPLEERDGARAKTTDAQERAMRLAQGHLVSRIHVLVDDANRKIWDFGDLIARVVVGPWVWAGYPPKGTLVSDMTRVIKEFVAGVLMAGYLRIVGYWCVSRAWSVDSAFVSTSRRTFVYFVPSILVAFAVAGVFLLLNALACDMPREALPNAVARWLGACRG